MGAAAYFLALCAQHGVDPNAIPDAPARQSLFPRRKGSPLGRRGRPRTPWSRDRRRTLGGSGALPPQLRHEYTEARTVSVYHGSTCLGRIVERAGRSEAFAADGARLGVFAWTKAAADAISAAHGGAQ